MNAVGIVLLVLALFGLLVAGYFYFKRPISVREYDNNLITAAQSRLMRAKENERRAKGEDGKRAARQEVRAAERDFHNMFSHIDHN